MADIQFDWSTIRSGCNERRSAKKRFVSFEITYKHISFRIEAILNGNRNGLRSSPF